MEEQMRLMCTMMERMMREQGMIASIDKAVDNILARVGIFEGMNLTRFLKIYNEEMLKRGVDEASKINSFSRVCAIGLQERIQELQRENQTWTTFERALLNEYNLNDMSRMTRRAFMDWVESDKHLSVLEVLKEFSERFEQLNVRDRNIIMPDKVILFLQATNIKDRKDLGMLLEDQNSPSGLTEDWEEVKRACTHFCKRKLWFMELPERKGDETRNDLGEKKVEDSLLHELVKGMKDLSIKVTKLESGQSSSSSWQGGGVVRRCMWCDSVDHQKKDCQEHRDALKHDKIYYQDGKIHSTETRQPLQLNFGRGGMKKLMEDAERETTQAIQSVATLGLRVEDSYGGSGFWQDVIEYARKGKVRVDELKKAGDEIRNFTGWNDPVDALSAFAQVNAQDVLVEEKRKRVEEVDPTKRHETREQKRREMEKGATEPKEADKVKGKTSPSFKLASDIETTTDIKQVLETRILNSKVEFTLREVLGIAKKEFHEVIIDIIRRKRQVTEEITGGCATTLQDLYGGTINAASLKNRNDVGVHEGDRSHYTRDHWARATTEAPAKIGEQQIPCIALIDHGSEINMMSSDFYAQGRWPIDKNHGWKIRAATETTEDLFGACPSVKVTIGDVSVNQNFFVQDRSTYPVILGQPYITAVRMETKVIDDGSAFARIKSQDGRKTVQFLTVRPNHERNKECLREHPIQEIDEEFSQDF